MKPDEDDLLDVDRAPEGGRVGLGGLGRGDGVDHEQGRSHVQGFVPARHPLGGEVGPLGITVLGSQLAVMIQVPPLELACGDGAGKRVEKPQDPFPERASLGENQVVNLHH